jgi:hypothetical protein
LEENHVETLFVMTEQLELIYLENLQAVRQGLSSVTVTKLGRDRYGSVVLCTVHQHDFDIRDILVGGNFLVRMCTTK